jgi:hypothetical protein
MLSRFGRLLASVVFAATWIGASGGARAAEQRVNNPKHPSGNLLDWCYDWSVGCGQQAADAYCKHRGFTRATNFQMAPNVGATTPTRLISTGAVCDQPFCDAFRFITCINPLFVKPRHPLGLRLDWCLNWATDCGKPVADTFCKRKGFSQGAASFEIAADIGSTRLIGTGAVCDQPFCDGFAHITCKE